MPFQLVVVAVLMMFSRIFEESMFRSVCGCRPVYNLVQTTMVDPNAAAVRAIVDLHSLTIGHFQLHVTNGAVHANVNCN